MSHLGRPDIVTAIARSCDGYFYRLGLLMGPDKFEKWVNIFRFGKRTGIDLPHEEPGLIPTRAVKENITRNIFKRRKSDPSEPFTEREEREFRSTAKWTEYDMAASAFGQGTNALTPIQLLRYVSGLAVGGSMHTPHLLLRAEQGYDHLGELHQETIVYEDKNTYVVPMSPNIQKIVKDGMWQAVNGNGTAAAARVDGFDVCGKTGTAQVASADKAGKKNQDHAWFMSFAPRDNPVISMVILTENAGFGGKQSAPRAKPIYELFCRRSGKCAPETNDPLAKNEKN